MESLLDQLDIALYGTDTRTLIEKLKSSYRVIEHKSEKLPNIYNKYLKDKQSFSLFVRSHMGSGKTYQLRNIINNLSRLAKTVKKEFKAVVISPRQMFTSCMVKKLPSFQEYRQIKSPYSHIRHPRLIVQVQSLKHFEDIMNDTHSVKGYWIVILDEVHSIIDELFSDLMNPSQKQTCMKIFVKVLRAIPRWICLDAHLSLDLVNILKEIDRESDLNKHALCLINTYKRHDFKLVFYRKCLFNGTVVKLFKMKLSKSKEFAKYKPLLCTQYIRSIVVDDNNNMLEKMFRKMYIRDLLKSEDTNDILVDLYDSLSRGSKICVTTSTKRQAKLLESIFKSCKFKVILLTGDSNDEQKRNFGQNPDKFICNCDLFIYTTAFQVGIDVSATNSYFDAHFIFIECSTSVPSPGAFVQALGRIRTLKSNIYKVIVVDGKKRSGIPTDSLNMNDMIPLNQDLVVPSGNINDKIKKKLVDFHFKEKALGKSVFFYVSMVIRLLSCKARPCVMINGNIYNTEDVVNFSTFQYSYKEYNSFVDNFILQYKDEIQTILDKHLGKIWQKLETSSIYVSTLVNNFDGFIKLPDNMSRSECLLRVCEFTSKPFGYLYSYIFCYDNDSDKNKRYFQHYNKTFFPKCDMQDMQRFKTIFNAFLKCCITTRKCSWSVKDGLFRSFLEQFKTDIVLCYSKFVSIVISKSSDIYEVFRNLMLKTVRLYVHKETVDFSEMQTYMKIIDIKKMVKHNAEQFICPTNIKCL